MGKSLNISLVATLTPLQKSLEMVGKMMSDFAKSIEATDKKLSDSIKDSVAQMNTELAKVQSSFDGVGKAGEGAGDKGGKGFKNMRTQMREANIEAQKALQKFGEFSPEFIAAAKNAARVRDEMGDLDSQIKALNPDAPFKAAVGVMQGLIGGVEVAKGAMVAFGIDSEGAEKSIAKLQGLMAMGQGLNELAEMRDKMKDFKLATLNSLPALNSMKGAIMATGIGLVIVAVGLLAANWDKVTEAVGGVSSAQKEQLEKGKLNIKQQEDKLKLLESQDNIFKLQGKSEREILSIKIAQTKEIIKASELLIADQKRLLQSQLAAQDRNKAILAGILRSMAEPIRMLLMSIDAIGNALGKNFGLAKGLSDGINSISGYVFDSEATRKKGEEDIRVMEATLVEMKNKQAGYQISVNEIHKKVVADELKKNEDLKKAFQDGEGNLERNIDFQLSQRKRISEKAQIKPTAAPNATTDISMPKMAGKQIVIGGVDRKTLEEEFSWRTKMYADYNKKVAEMSDGAAKKSADYSAALNKAISDMTAKSLVLLGESIGQMFTGDFSAKNFLNSMLLIVSDFATQLGTAFIGIAASTDAFKVALGGLPGVAIAIGIGLVAVGGAIKAGVARMSEKPKASYAIGSRYIPYDMTAQIHKGEMIIPASENPYANSGGRVIPGGGSSVLALSTTLRGSDIRISADKTNRTYNRITGRG